MGSGRPEFFARCGSNDQVRNILRLIMDSRAWRCLHARSTDDGSSEQAIICTVLFFQMRRGKNSALLAQTDIGRMWFTAGGWGQTADNGVKIIR